MPYAYDCLRIAGALYLVRLASQAVRPGGRSPFQVKTLVQIVVSVSVNALIAMSAGTIAIFLARRPTWLAIQRYLRALVLAGLAVRIATKAQR